MKFFAARQNIQRLHARLALLLSVVLVTHSLDVCAAHTGIPNLPSAQITSVTHGEAKCAAPPGVACLCAECACVPVPLEDNHGDGCSATSELSTRAQSIGFQFDAPQFTNPMLSATEPATPILLAPLAAFLGGNGPPLANLRNQFLFLPFPAALLPFRSESAPKRLVPAHPW